MNSRAIALCSMLRSPFPFAAYPTNRVGTGGPVVLP